MPNLQVEFSAALEKIRHECLQEALAGTIRQMNIVQIDAELSKFVSSEALSALASVGLRGELLFPVPCVITKNPRLIGYYRLLLGFSKKEFYSTSSGTSIFKSMEEKGKTSNAASNLISDFCRAFITCSEHLLFGIGPVKFTPQLLYDLTLLTLGPQLRGGANVKKGSKAIQEVFELINEIVTQFITNKSASKIQLINSAKRKVIIQFAPDPDIVIQEEISQDTIINKIAIEVKGGTDFSNIHNRFGEAEKSHQKAKGLGFVEYWTVINIESFDHKLAKKESPTTTRFYKLPALNKRVGDDYNDFAQRIELLTGIPGSIKNRG